MTANDHIKASEDITCEACGKMNGNEQVGNSWICTDCKVTKISEDDSNA